MSAEMRRIHKTRFLLSVVLFVLFAACFSLMPWASAQRREGAPGPIFGLGAAFWLTGLLACLFLHLADQAGAKLSSGSSTPRKRGRPGLFCFFRNREAVLADVLLLIGAGIFFAARIFRQPNSILFPAISVMLLLVIVHAFLNGRNYRLLRGRRRAHQDIKEEQTKK